MNLAELGKTVAKYAPAIGALLPLPGGAAIGTAIAAAFGGDIKDPEALAWKIQQDPQAAIKLAELQNNLQIGMRQADVEDYKTEVDDRKSARQRVIELAKIGIRDYTQEIIAISLVLGCLWMLHTYQITPTVEAKDLVLAIIAILSQVISYYFGSSPGERRSSTKNNEAA
jgi:hypothetical protein